MLNKIYLRKGKCTGKTLPPPIWHLQRKIFCYKFHIFNTQNISESIYHCQSVSLCLSLLLYSVNLHCHYPHFPNTGCHHFTTSSLASQNMCLVDPSIPLYMQHCFNASMIKANANHLKKWDMKLKWLSWVESQVWSVYNAKLFHPHWKLLTDCNVCHVLFVNKCWLHQLYKDDYGTHCH